MDSADDWADARADQRGGNGTVRQFSSRGRSGDRRDARPGGSEGRVPPHNLQAEEAVLGAILLSREALANVVEVGLRYDDFYKPAHQHIFDVAFAVSQSGLPADTITVGNELEKAGLLDSIGGVETLHALQNTTPAISNAAHYARIVQDAAMLRRVIMVAGDISELAYSGPDNVDTLLDDVETRVYKVADRRIADTYKPISELMGDAVERIEENYSRKSAITGVPTGYTDLDLLLAGLQPGTLNIVGARPAMGKALSLSTELPTPTGWTTMGEVRVGDELLDEQGQRCRVTYVTPVQLGNECFEVRFDDGSTVVADADHQWFAFDLAAWKSLRGQGHSRASQPAHPGLARDQGARWRLPRVVTTRQMLDEGVRAADRGPNWYIQLAAPLDLPEASLPVDPYVFGCWLGDGSTAHAAMTIDPVDVEHFTAEFEHAGYMLRQADRMTFRTCPPRGSRPEHGATQPRSLRAELIELGFLRGATKHIPQCYLRGSFKQRLALLQGIMDTDGHARPGEHLVELTFADRDLTEQVHELVCSLGHKAHEIHERAISLDDGRRTTAWRFTWSPLDPVFRLPRKAAANLAPVPGAHREFTRRAVASITPMKSVPVRCITVDSPNSLYLAGRTMIPTHNTAFGLGMAVNIAKKTHRPVLVFSLEMGHIELTQRILSSEAEVDSTKIRSGQLDEPDWKAIGQAIGRLEVPLFLDENPRVTVMEIRAKARRLKMQHGDLGLILIDYLQLMSGSSTAENRQLEVSEISRNLKILARELDVPVVALSQLSRNLESRSDKRPMLSDLRESGSLEQDSDVVMFLYRDEVYNRESPDRGAADVIVAKHRAGPIGDLRLVFRGQYARFDNAAPRNMG